MFLVNKVKGFFGGNKQSQEEKDFHEEIKNFTITGDLYKYARSSGVKE